VLSLACRREEPPPPLVSGAQVSFDGARVRLHGARGETLGVRLAKPWARLSLPPQIASVASDDGSFNVMIRQDAPPGRYRGQLLADERAFTVELTVDAPPSYNDGGTHAPR
jgi:hypothetical protein